MNAKSVKYVLLCLGRHVVSESTLRKLWIQDVKASSLPALTCWQIGHGAASFSQVTWSGACSALHDLTVFV